MEVIEKLRAAIHLSFEEAGCLFDAMLDGRMEEGQIEEVLLLLSDKGETEEEIAGAARSLLARSIRFPHSFERLLDTAGTGGDDRGTFNISTTAAIVCSIFLPVAKHGNRAVSSMSGSADVLEALKVPIDLPAEEASRVLKEKNFVFIFAQKYFPAMRFVTGARKKIGKRTIFNLLGPLCNPARPGNEPRQVFDEISQIKVVDVVMPTKQGTIITKRCISQPTKAQSVLLQRLNLQLPQYMKTYQL